MLRNFAYYLCPIAGTPGWQENLNDLEPYWPIFNNKIVLAIATVSQTNLQLAPLGEVLSALPKQVRERAQVIPVTNRPELRETAHFFKLLEAVKSHAVDETTFYAHGKGVSYIRKDKRQDNVRKWRHNSYKYCLRDPGLVDDVMARYSCAGCFRRMGPETPLAFTPLACTPWHFMGTFFWFNHYKTFGPEENNHFYATDKFEKWKQLDPRLCAYGVEGWPGIMWPASESYCFFGDHVTESNLYKWDGDMWQALFDYEEARELLRKSNWNQLLASGPPPIVYNRSY